jgi:hypothetical protein
LSGLNNDFSLAVGDAEWAGVLNKPAFISGWYINLTDA